MRRYFVQFKHCVVSKFCYEKYGSLLIILPTPNTVFITGVYNTAA